MVIKKKRKTKYKKVKPPKRYRYSYDELSGLNDTKLEWFETNGFPEEQDMARGIRVDRRKMRLATYGY